MCTVTEIAAHQVNVRTHQGIIQESMTHGERGEEENKRKDRDASNHTKEPQEDGGHRDGG
jgi:hypothetical protein